MPLLRDVEDLLCLIELGRHRAANLQTCPHYFQIWTTAHPAMFADPKHMAYSALLTASSVYFLVFDTLLFTSCLLPPTSPPSTFESHVVNTSFTSTHLSTTVPTTSLLPYFSKPANRILLSLLHLFQSLSRTHTASKSVYLAITSEFWSVE
jgi:hypothetical protein